MRAEHPLASAVLSPRLGALRVRAARAACLLRAKAVRPKEARWAKAGFWAKLATRVKRTTAVKAALPERRGPRSGRLLLRDIFANACGG